MPKLRLNPCTICGWLWQFLTHINFNITHTYCHTVEDMYIWPYYRWHTFTWFSSTVVCSKVQRWAGQKSCSQIRSGGWGLGNSERAACQMLRSCDTRKGYKQSSYFCILAINKHKPHHLFWCVWCVLFYLKRTWNKGGIGCVIWHLWPFPLNWRIQFFFMRTVFFYFIGLKVKSTICNILFYLYSSQNWVGQVWDSLFPTVPEGNRSTAKLGGKKTRWSQPEDRVFHRRLLFVDQNAELAEVSVWASQDVSCKSGGESSVGKFSLGFEILYGCGVSYLLTEPLVNTGCFDACSVKE